MMDEHIGKRLTILETKFKERWDAHDQRSDEQWGYVKDKLDKLPCSAVFKEVAENSRFRKGATKALWALYAITIGWIAKVILWK